MGDWIMLLSDATQAEEVSGLPRASQRDLRRRLPDLIEPPDHDAFELAHMTIVRSASDTGIGPATAMSWKRLVACCIVSHALRSPQAYDVASRHLPSDLSEVRNDILRAKHSAWGEKLPKNAHGCIYRAPRFAMWSNDADGQMGDSLDGLYEESFKASRKSVPTIIFDVHAAATDLLRDAGFLVALPPYRVMPKLMRGARRADPVE